MLGKIEGRKGRLRIDVTPGCWEAAGGAEAVKPMWWLGRGRALYKLSIGGHSALVSKDHVCESGFPVRKIFARGCGYLLCYPFRRLQWGELRPPQPQAPQRWGETQDGRIRRVEGGGVRGGSTTDVAARPWERPRTAWLSGPSSRG